MMRRSDGKALLELAVILALFSLFAAIVVVKVNDGLAQPFNSVALTMGGGSSTTMAGEDTNTVEPTHAPTVTCSTDECAAPVE